MPVVCLLVTVGSAFAQHRVDPAIVLKLVQKEPKSYRLDGPSRLRFTRRSDPGAARIQTAEALLAALGSR